MNREDIYRMLWEIQNAEDVAERPTLRGEVKVKKPEELAYIKKQIKFVSVRGKNREGS